TVEDALFGIAISLKASVGPVGLPSSPTTIVKTFDGSTGGGIDPTTNQITISLGRASGSGLAFNLLGTQLVTGQPVLYEQGSNPAIPGLINGDIYWVIVPQSQYDPSGNEALISFGLTETIRLAASRAAAEAGVALGLGCTANAAAGEPCTGSGYKLVAVHSLTPVEASGIGATATLQSTDEAVGSASLGDTQTGTVQKIKSGIKKATQGLTNKIINALVWKLAAKLGSTQKQDQLPAKKSFAAAGGFAFTYADHTVNVTLGPGAQLSSQGALVLDADASESAQVFAAAKISGTSSKPSEKRQASQHQTSISAALAIADDYNSATTDVGSDAVLNSPGVTAIDSGVSYPLLSTVSGLPTSVGELVGSLRSGKAVSSIENVIAYSTNAPLLLFANGLATAAAQASEVAFAASVTFLFLTGDAETDVATGTQINQSTAASPPAGQLVVIGAENSDALIL
ncbi:MAG: hypothetical protein ACRDL8_09745, partial [Solirubrobacteraceae bacterium]